MGYTNVRLWSNEDVRKVGELLGHLHGIINVSGDLDEDKYGSHYRNYFNTAKYDISNYESDDFRGGSGDSLKIDLEKPIPSSLLNSYELVFNHTTLEHVWDVRMAMDNLVKLSSRYIYIIVPFKQKLHFYDEGFKDYHRLTHFWFREYAKRNQLKVLYENYGPKDSLDVYISVLLSKNQQDAEMDILDMSNLNRRLGSNYLKSVMREGGKLLLQRLVRH